MLTLGRCKNKTKGLPLNGWKSLLRSFLVMQQHSNEIKRMLISRCLYILEQIVMLNIPPYQPGIVPLCIPKKRLKRNLKKGTTS